MQNMGDFCIIMQNIEYSRKSVKYLRFFSKIFAQVEKLYYLCINKKGGESSPICLT